MDPFLAGAIGGASGKFVEKAWDSTERWLKSKFKDQQPAAQQKARENAGSMVRTLAKKVWLLEQESELNKSVIECAFAHPQIGALLQRAVLGASQTENGDKHGVLASLVAERLRVEVDPLVWTGGGFDLVMVTE